ncbi:hypothetical protein MCGE09_00450 [Thaumarchaeota archaeon SCGC AB-539-E09]|nr:hypothetical protein MCGE09_00450 [Thaumarchaeota archaeon SCGC AB-539-E09]
MRVRKRAQWVELASKILKLNIQYSLQHYWIILVNSMLKVERLFTEIAPRKQSGEWLNGREKNGEVTCAVALLLMI